MLLICPPYDNTINLSTKSLARRIRLSVFKGPIDHALKQSNVNIVQCF